MAVKRISPEEAKDLMDRDGFVYVDVRSIPEFEAGHPEGAYNVPLLHMGSMGMAPNPEFLAVMEKSFSRDTRIVVGCKSGGRSIQAATMLEATGYTHVVEQRCGYDGSMGPRPEPGWRPKGLPVSTQALPNRTYDGLKAKAR